MPRIDVVPKCYVKALDLSTFPYTCILEVVRLVAMNVVAERRLRMLTAYK